MPKRPWDDTGARQRLGLKVGGSPNRAAGLSIGWWLFKVASAKDRTGETPVPHSPIKGRALSAAEFRTLRAECGLSQSEAQELYGVAQKTISHWENRRGATEEVALTLQALRSHIDDAVEAAVAQACELGAKTVDLYAYRANEYQSSTPASEGLPHGAHWRLLSLTASALMDKGVEVNITYAE